MRLTLAWRPARVAALSAALLLATACGGGDDNGGTTNPTPSIGVTLATPAVSIAQGQNGTAAVTVSRAGGYAGAVTLATTAPTGLTATFNPASLPNGTTASTLTVSVAPTVTAGSYPLTITASGTGVANQTATLTVTVTAAPSITVALSPATVSVAQGGSGTSTLAVTRAGGFSGPVAVAVSGAPTGLTVTPASASVTDPSVAIAVSAAAGLAAGSYPVTVTVSGTGVATQTATLTVTVTAAQPQGSYTIALSPAAVSLAQGGTTATALNLTRSGGFAGAVGIAVSGAPTGLTVTPASTSITGNSVALNVAAAAGLAPGSYPVTVTTTAGGLADQTATLTVTVTAAQQGSIGISLAPTSVSVPQGGSGTSTLTVTRAGGFTGAVDVATSGAPNGVTVTPASGSVAGGSVALNVAATAAAAPGSYPVTVTASASGVASQTATLTVTVTSASGGGVNFSFCTDAVPLWVGYQTSETGAWTRATVGAGGAVSVPITGTKGAVAYVTQAGAGYNLSIVYGAPAELATYGASACAVGGGGKTVTGTVAGVGATDVATITLGSATASVSGAAGSSFTLNNVPAGPRDLLGTRASFSLTGGSFTINKGFLRRNVNVPSGGSVGTVDFNGSESFTPATANVTIAGAGTDLAFPTVSYLTANGSSGTFFTGLSGLLGGGTPPATQQYAGVPASLQAAGDFHLLTVIAFPGSAANLDATNFRMAAVYFRAVADRTVTLGAPLSAPTVTLAATTPYPRPRVQLARQAEYGDGFAATFSQASSTAPRTVTLVALSSYVGGGSWDFTVPDLTGAAGFDPTWALRPGAQISWTATAYGGSVAAFAGGTPTEGSIFRAAGRTGTLAAALRRALR